MTGIDIGPVADGEATGSGLARNAPLAMGAEEFRAVGHALVDTVARFLAQQAERPLAVHESPGQVRAALEAVRSLPPNGERADQLVNAAADLLVRHSLFNGHPRFFGYITAAPAPIGILGDFLASAINANCGAWRLAPMATEIEAQSVRWIAELIGYPVDCGGVFVSGGNMANFVGMLTARVTVADWDVRRTGVADAGARPLRVYASAETHTWIQKAADLSGIGTDSIRWIPADTSQRMDTVALGDAIARDQAAGECAMMVVGTAGSVSTGAVDPLHEIADICSRSGAWFHVDGAYGAFAAAVPGAPQDLQSIRRADSVAVDPHKWLYAPLEAGCALVRDANRLRNAFAYHPPYYHFGEEATNYVEYGPQNSRGFRALKVWLALQHVGRDGYVRMIADDIRLSERMFERVAAHPELEAVTQSLSITTFRFVPADLRAAADRESVRDYLNALNTALLERIQASGELFVSNAVIGGLYVLRACIVNFHTDATDIDAIPDIVVRLGRAADAELRAERANGI